MSQTKRAKDTCDVCEAPDPTEYVKTKAHGTLKTCKRCADWIRAHRYEAA